MMGADDPMPSRLPRPRPTGWAAMATAAILIAWIVLDHGGSSSSVPTIPASATAGSTAPASTPTITASSAAASFGPVLLTAAALRERVATLGRPVYWLGPEPTHTYELTAKADGAVLLRYLPADAALGDRRALRSVGTYPVADAFAATGRLGDERGAFSRRRSDGALVVSAPDRPTSAYVAYPGGESQIEVFDPSPGAARRLALSRLLQPVR